DSQEPRHGDRGSKGEDVVQNNNSNISSEDRRATRTVSLDAPETDPTSVLEGLYRATVFERNMLHLQVGVWPTDAETLDSLKQAGTVLMSVKVGRRESAVVQLADALVLAHLSDGHVLGTAASQTAEVAERAL